MEGVIQATLVIIPLGSNLPFLNVTYGLFYISSCCFAAKTPGKKAAIYPDKIAKKYFQIYEQSCGNLCFEF
jgi:hypothetical protein